MRARHLLLVTALAWAGCTDDNPSKRQTPDLGGVGDGGAAFDGGGGQFMDAGPMPDGGDAAVAADDGVAEDAAPDEGIDPDDGVPLDEGVIDPDAEVPDPDDGVPPPDAAVPDPDAEVIEPDAEVPDPDAAMPDPDAAMPDAEVVEPDAAPCVDCDEDGVSAAQGDCDDDDPGRFPGNPEICDGIDNDCDQTVDGLARECFDGDPDLLGAGRCRPGVSTCLAGAFGPCEGQVLPADAEICGNGLDDTCDDEVDEGCDGDGDGFTPGQNDCDDDDPDINPDAEEICDGVDNDCDGVTDGLTEPCYDGPDGTAGEGLCRAGERVCRGGDFGGCEGQVLPVEEACGDMQDNDCDGEIDEGCDVDPCPVDPDSPVTITATCMAVGSSAQSLVIVDVRDRDGAPMADVTVDIQGPADIPANAVGTAAGRWYRLFSAGFRPSEGEVRVTVQCADGPPVALRSTPQLRQVPQPPAAGASIRTGGCADPEGNVLVYVTDAETGAPVAGAAVMAGDAPQSTLIRGTLTAVRGAAGLSPNRATSNASGVVVLRDLGDTLDGPQTITVGAEGYAFETLVGVGASVIRVPLRASDSPLPAQSTLGGTLEDFNDLSRDGQTDAALVLAPFDLSLLARLAIPRLLSRQDCWDPITEGLAGEIVPEVGVPGNLFVPGQGESLNILPVTVETHRFALDSMPPGPSHLVGLAGKLPTNDVAALAGGGGGLSGVLEIMRFFELGVRDVDVDGDDPNLVIPLSIDLAENATCALSNLPADTSALCTTAGDWDGLRGSGELFPMGLASGDAANGAANLSVTTAPAAGVLRNISYVSAALGIYPTDGAPAGLLNAGTAIVDRDSIDGTGGVFNADSFLGTTPLSRELLTFNWNPVEREQSPPVDACRVDVVRIVRAIYNPGACSPLLADTREVPVWSAYVAGDPGTLSLPELAADWPRAASQGLIDPALTPADDRLEVRLSCMHLGDADFTFDAADFAALIDGLTHLSVNQIRF